MRVQFIVIAMLLATVFTQVAVAPKPAAKAKVTVKPPAVKAKVSVKAKVPAAKAKVSVKKPAVKAKVAVKAPAVKAKVGVKAKVTVPKIKIGAKVDTGAKATVKAAPKANLTGSCPAAKQFKSLEVLSKPVEYKSQSMCKGLKTGCCSEKSLNDFKDAWPMWVKMKSAFFWTLSKWPQGLATILRYQNKSLACKLQPKKDVKAVIKAGSKVAAPSKKKRILQVAVSAKPAASASAKVSVKATVPKINIKAGLKKTGDAIKKTGAKISASVKKAGAKVSAEAKKVGAKISAGAKKVGANIKIGVKKTGDALKKTGAKISAEAKKVGAKISASAKKASANIKIGLKKTGDAMKKTGLKIKAGLDKFGKDAKKTALDIKAKITKMFKATKPQDWMKGTGCNALFQDAWKMTMPFMRMRKAAAALGLQCFKAVAKARSSAVCAVCDNTNAEKFKSGLNVGGPFFNEIPQACAPFLSWVGSYYKVQASIAKYAAATNMKTPLTINAEGILKESSRWEAGLSSCFTDATPAPAKKDDKKTPAKKDDKKTPAKKDDKKTPAKTDKKRVLQAKVTAKAPAAKAKVSVKAKVPAVKAKVAVKKPVVKAKVAVKKPAVKAKVGVKAKVAVPKVKITAKKPAVKGKLTIKAKVPKVKVSIKAKGKTTAKAVPITFAIGKKGWALKSGQKLAALDTSFSAFEKAKQTGNWAGKVTATCVASPIMKEWVTKLLTNDIMDDIKFSKKFWKGALELNSRIGRGAASRFAKFLGKKILGIKAAAKKLTIKLKGKASKLGLKIKANAKKTGNAVKDFFKKAGAKISAGVKKAGVSIKAGIKKTGDALKKTGAKISAESKKIGAKISAGAKKTGAAIKAGAAKASASIKAGLKVKVPKVKVAVKAPKVKVGVKASASVKAKRRLQTAAPATPAPATPATPAASVNVSTNGVNLADAKYDANVAQPTALAGEGQATPSKSWMMFAGLMTFVALLLN